MISKRWSRMFCITDRSHTFHRITEVTVFAINENEKQKQFNSCEWLAAKFNINATDRSIKSITKTALLTKAVCHIYGCVVFNLPPFVATLYMMMFAFNQYFRKFYYCHATCSILVLSPLASSSVFLLAFHNMLSATHHI